MSLVHGCDARGWNAAPDLDSDHFRITSEVVCGEVVPFAHHTSKKARYLFDKVPNWKVLHQSRARYVKCWCCAHQVNVIIHKVSKMPSLAISYAFWTNVYGIMVYGIPFLTKPSTVRAIGDGEIAQTNKCPTYSTVRWSSIFPSAKWIVENKTDVQIVLSRHTDIVSQCLHSVKVDYADDRKNLKVRERHVKK